MSPAAADPFPCCIHADSKPQRPHRLLLAGLITASLAAVAARAGGGPAVLRDFSTRPDIHYAALAMGFAAPPPEARMRAWWFWHSGLATKQSITRDLEAMQANGIGGVILCDNGTKHGPQGPVFMSKDWQDLFAQAVREATRLGIEISLNIQSGCGDPGNPNIANDNGLKKLVTAEATVSGPGKVDIKLPMPPANPIFYQDVAVQAVRKTPAKTGDDAIRNWQVKTFEKNDFNLQNYYDEFPGDGTEQAIDPLQTLDLTTSLRDGVLRWDAPAGDWTVIRYGMTSTGKRNNYASAGYRNGLCYDPIHQAGVTAQWNDVVKPLIDVARANGDSLKFLHVDSWEMGLCNWTHGFEESFQQRRGYDLRPYLPVLAGYIVTSREVSNRVLEDFRQTVGDLAAEDHYGELKRLAHSEGLALHMESAGPHQPPVDGLRTLGINDIPMGEAWARSTTHRVAEPARMQVALGASAAHIYGKRFLAAEAPTSVGPFWQRGPHEVKNVLDRIFCTGVNRVNWHTYDSSPDEFGLPGIAYFAGTHLNRNVTWWKQSQSFISYINRSQHMLAQGLHVADVLGFLGSRAPQFAVLHRLERNDIPAGYAWDMCNAHAFLTRASVDGGRIVLPDGKSYALFALSDGKPMELPVLRKIERMVDEGMVLVGKPPQRPFGLGGYPESDAEFKDLVGKLWGGADGSVPREKPHGKGRVFTGHPVSQVLTTLAIGPDLAWRPNEGVDLEYIHHRSADDQVDVYYVINKWARHGINDLGYRYLPTLPDRFINVTGSFRVAGGRLVERWDPVRGTITPVHVMECKDGYHHLPVSLEPEGGAFYVFRKARPLNHIVRIAKDGTARIDGNTPLEVGASRIFVRDGALEVLENGRYEVTFANGRTVRIAPPAALASLSINGPWKVDFLERPQLGAPFSTTCETLKSWTDSTEHREKYFSGTARYTRSFTLDPAAIATDRRAYLDLGFVGDIATVRINGREVGILWKPPYMADITGFLKPGDNLLEVEVTNQWVNRLVGDLKLPAAERKTRTSVLEGPPDARKDPRSPRRLGQPDANKYLRVSGLLGPVGIRFSRILPIIP
jgi:hypothetical protein